MFLFLRRFVLDLEALEQIRNCYFVVTLKTVHHRGPSCHREMLNDQCRLALFHLPAFQYRVPKMYRRARYISARRSREKLS